MDLKKFNLPRYLATLPLFSNMRDEELARLASGCQLRRMERGKLVFRTGEPCQEFHVTVLGQVKLFAIAPNGTEKVIELCGPGHSFAEAVMFMDMPYMISAQTLTDSLILTVGKAAVLGEIAANPDFSLRMLAGLARRLHGLVKDVEAYTLHSGVQRVIGYLLGDRVSESEVASESITVSLPVSKAAIASRLSLTPEYFSRVLNELETAGLIQVDKRDIRIPDTARLANHQPL
ncbi:MAG TPA: Crp/Fnr family transcriptional regulator [Ottowia sp.]|uniref:Crp/Fnr family transcriptional regulator n=1 Tax=Ottowia sp. TaxID=1898956 RepID=UPI0011D985AD|nr:Crp/Fnr family transcriptional regulator [Ottowia sp.]TXI16911.1 MAG: Crp/Fnr family transcriptional regulator [Ottowia sp.]HNE60738.1 Crp/Fnr family transcriptional regulator [Ottowia sp.]HNI84430.1 Crp/Fnr family transcriptional regulator [Ottowia sp.]HNJ45172.1 Crp/Fnr family transcriptional regulator [Ottowia sp.]HNL41445.1 Crp/Fnr family transcriptional regulator [Ottowia sp.]